MRERFRFGEFLGERVGRTGVYARRSIPTVRNLDTAHEHQKRQTLPPWRYAS